MTYDLIKKYGGAFAVKTCWLHVVGKLTVSEFRETHLFVVITKIPELLTKCNLRTL